MSFNNINSLFESLLGPYVKKINYNDEIQKIINYYDLQFSKYSNNTNISKYKQDIDKIKNLISKNNLDEKSIMTIYYYLANIYDEIYEYLETSNDNENNIPTKIQKTGRLFNEEKNVETKKSNCIDENIQENEENKIDTDDIIDKTIDQFMNIFDNNIVNDKTDNNKIKNNFNTDQLVSTPLTTKTKKINNTENNENKKEEKVKKENVNEIEENTDIENQTMVYWYKGEDNYLTIKCTERLIKVIFVLDDNNVFKNSDIVLVNNYLSSQKLNIELMENLIYNSVIDNEYEKIIDSIKILKIFIDNQEDFKKFIAEMTKKDDNIKKEIQNLIDNIKQKYSFIPNIENHIKRIFNDIIKHEYIDKNTLDFEIIYKPLYEILKNTNDKNIKNIDNYKI
jgi:hypothetical protein